MLSSRKSPRKFDEKGFLLLEVIVSVVVIASGLLFVARSYGTSRKTIEASSEVLTESLLLQKKMFECEVAGRIDEGEKGGVFDDNGRFSWNIKAKAIPGSEVNEVVLDVFPGSAPRLKRSLVTYLHNKSLDEESGEK